MFEKKEDSNQPPIDTNPNYPVHTMESDLKDLGQNNSPGTDASIEISAPKKETASPFLNQASWTKSAQEQNLTADTPQKKGLSRTVVWGVIIFIILVAAAGAYYFWVTRVDVPAENLQSLPETSKAPEIPQFSPDKPNYLIIEDGLTLKDALAEYAEKVSQANLITPVEFILTDSQNNNISVVNFFSRDGIDLPENILAQLKPSFSLYFFNDQGNMRTGLALSQISGDTSNLELAVLQEEINLVDLFRPILNEDVEVNGSISFGESYYGGSTIRYFNLTEKEDISVDYTFKDGQWLIGTSKMTMRAMIDNIGKDYQPID